MAKINIGKMPCETCNNTVTVKQNENATLSYRCDECDAAPYAKTGTLQNLKWREKLAPIAQTEPASEAEPAPAAQVSQVKLKLDMWGNPV